MNAGCFPARGGAAMLVLSRKDGNAIHVGGDVVVRVLRIGRSQVRLGIEAPESMPIWREELSDSFGWGLPQSAQVAGQTSARRRTEILLVEDNPDHAELISRVLCDSEPVEVEIVRSGEAAIDLLGIGDGQIIAPQGRYDLILMDQGLPGTTGIEVLRRIRTAPDWFATPVVMLTCMDDEGLVADCFEAGANAFVVKSGDMRTFRATISRIAAFWGNDCRTPKACASLPR
jgi:carbon storage regulator CsrA